MNSLQNSPSLTKNELDAFQNTKYDGEIQIHESRLEKYANLYKGSQTLLSTFLQEWLLMLSTIQNLLSIWSLRWREKQR